MDRQLLVSRPRTLPTLPGTDFVLPPRSCPHLLGQRRDPSLRRPRDWLARNHSRVIQRHGTQLDVGLPSISLARYTDSAASALPHGAHAQLLSKCTRCFNNHHTSLCSVAGSAKFVGTLGESVLCFLFSFPHARSVGLARSPCCDITPVARLYDQAHVLDTNEGWSDLEIETRGVRVVKRSVCESSTADWGGEGWHKVA